MGSRSVSCSFTGPDSALCMSGRGKVSLMRRKDTEVTRREDLLEMIARFKVCRLGLWDGTEVYMVPLNFGYEDRDGSLELFFHCAREGRKLDILQSRPAASFEMDGDHMLIEGKNPCLYSYAYACVMGRGTVEILQEDGEKIHALSRIMLQQTGREVAFTPAMARAVCVLRLRVESMSGKLQACPELPSA